MAKRWNIILPFVVIIIVAIIVFIKRDDLGAFVETIQNVEVIPFVIAFCCLFGRYFSHAFAYKAVFRCVDEDVKYLHIVPLVFSVTFANDCAPTAGTAGSVLIAAWSHKQGLDMGKSVTVVFLEKIGYFGGFAVVMLVGFSILIFTGQMVWYLALGGLAVALMIFAFGFVMWLGYGHVETERKLFVWIENLVNSALVAFKRKPMEPWADRIAASFHEASSIAVEKPRALVIMFARMVLLHAFDCMCFIFVGIAFGYDYIPFLIASYVAGFIIATFILQTIGAVEILLALVLAAYGCTPAQAAAIALAYRGLIFWIPFIIGAICINITGAQKQVFAKGSEELLEQGGDEIAAQVGFTEGDEALKYDDVSDMLPVPPASWVAEQNRKKGPKVVIDLADIVESFKKESLVTYEVNEEDITLEINITHNDQDKVNTGKTACQDNNEDDSIGIVISDDNCSLCDQDTLDNDSASESIEASESDELEADEQESVGSETEEGE